MSKSRGRKSRTPEDAEKFGFRWGPLDVTRLAEFDTHHCIEVSSDFNSISVYVSPTGRSLRVFRDGVELK